MFVTSLEFIRNPEINTGAFAVIFRHAQSSKNFSCQLRLNKFSAFLFHLKLNYLMAGFFHFLLIVGGCCFRWPPISPCESTGHESPQILNLPAP